MATSQYDAQLDQLIADMKVKEQTDLDAADKVATTAATALAADKDASDAVDAKAKAHADFAAAEQAVITLLGVMLNPPAPPPSPAPGPALNTPLG